jgi:hypothetical protein
MKDCARSLSRIGAAVTLAMLLALPTSIARAADPDWVPGTTVTGLSTIMQTFLQIEQQIAQFRFQLQAATKLQATLGQQIIALAAGQGSNPQAAMQQTQAMATFEQAGAVQAVDTALLIGKVNDMQAFVTQAITTLVRQLGAANPKADGPTVTAQKTYVVAQLTILKNALVAENAALAADKLQSDASKVLVQRTLDALAVATGSISAIVNTLQAQVATNQNNSLTLAKLAATIDAKDTLLSTISQIIAAVLAQR